MGWPVEWLKRMISAREFEMWCKYFRRRPFDDESVYHVPIAQLASLYTNAHLAENKESTTPSDFLTFRPKQTQSVDLDAKFKAFFLRFQQTQSPA